MFVKLFTGLPHPLSLPKYDISGIEFE